MKILSDINEVHGLKEVGDHWWGAVMLMVERDRAEDEVLFESD